VLQTEAESRARLGESPAAPEAAREEQPAPPSDSSLLRATAAADRAAGALGKLQRLFVSHDWQDQLGVIGGGVLGGLIAGTCLHVLTGIFAVYDSFDKQWLAIVLCCYLAVPLFAGLASWLGFKRLGQRYDAYFQQVFENGSVMQLLLEHELPLNWPRWQGRGLGKASLWQQLNSNINNQLDADSFCGRMVLFIRDFRPSMLPWPMSHEYPQYPLASVAPALSGLACAGCLYPPVMPLSLMLLIASNQLEAARRSGMRAALLRYLG
jgi:hypothetical protein